MPSRSVQYMYRPRYIVRNHTRSSWEKYILRERIISISGNDFDISRAWPGNRAFRIRGDTLSLHDTKVMYDNNDRPILTMRSALFSPRGRMRIKDFHTGQHVVTMRRKSIVPMEMLGGGTIRVWRGSREFGNPLYEVRGGMYGKWFSIVDGTWGEEVASIRRKSLTFASVVGRSTYIMRMRPDYDAAIFVFLAVAIDEYYRE